MPQGSVLAPLLYNLYLSDLPMPTRTNIKVAAYADDVIVFACGAKLITQQNEINAYLNEIDVL